jgi:hypothetical protein
MRRLSCLRTLPVARQQPRVLLKDDTAPETITRPGGTGNQSSAQAYSPRIAVD